jgi:hypothetical protein
MCQGILQEHPVFDHPHFRMLQVNCLSQMGKHLLVDHSTLRNKSVVHDSQPIKKDFQHIFPVEQSCQNFTALGNFYRGFLLVD